MRINIIILVLGSIIISCKQPQLNAEDVLKMSSDALAKNNLYEYDYLYKYKSFDNKDTISETFKSVLLKTSKDTILNAYVKLSGVTMRANIEHPWEKIYNGDEVTFIYYSSKSIFKSKVALFGENYVEKNFPDKQLPRFFTDSAFFKRYSEKTIDIKISDAIVENKEAWKINMLLPTNEDITFGQTNIYISKDDFLPVKIQSFYRYQDIQDQYFECLINNLKVYTTNEITFDNYYNVPIDYKIEVREPPKKVDYSLLPNGSDFSPFKGDNIRGNEIEVNEELVKDQLILLDFWYLGCGPCLKAMPKLAEIYERYRDQGFEIYGLNPYDDTGQIEDIKAFASKFNVNYKLLFVNKDIVNNYLVKTYPSFYLIKDGKIIYSHRGYYEDDKGFLELEEIINSNLKD